MLDDKKKEIEKINLEIKRGKAKIQYLKDNIGNKNLPIPTEVIQKRINDLETVVNGLILTVFEIEFEVEYEETC